MKIHLSKIDYKEKTIDWFYDFLIIIICKKRPLKVVFGEYSRVLFLRMHPQAAENASSRR